ncbi:hypothetical protein J6590_102791 [Homalodisca vitripennis]|nr:hypothetical protein J6590_043556 [Homalodisca vitripennis]KAG8318909.1 hypothetical protein J6590_102791 [Homalodisca vitripennis]
MEDTCCKTMLQRELWKERCSDAGLVGEVECRDAISALHQRSSLQQTVRRLLSAAFK